MIDIGTLSDAVNDNEIRKVKAILREQPDLVNQQDETGFTSIHWAVHHEFLDIFNFLVSIGADPNVVDFVGETPLHLSAKKGFVEIANSLIVAGARVDIRSGRHAGKLTPLYLAAERFDSIPPYDQPYRRIAELLIQSGATVDANSAVLMGDNEKLKELIAENPNLGVVSLDRHRLLENAASVFNVEGAKILLNNGRLPNRNALKEAMRVSQNRTNDQASLKILELYLEAGAGEYLHTIDRRVDSGTPYSYAKELDANIGTYKPPVGFMELIEKFNPERE